MKIRADYGDAMGLFGKKKSGQAFMDAYRQTYETQLRERAGSQPTPEQFAVAHDQALEWAYRSALDVGVLHGQGLLDLEWLRRSARNYGVNEEAAVEALCGQAVADQLRPQRTMTRQQVAN